MTCVVQILELVTFIVVHKLKLKD